MPKRIGHLFEKAFTIENIYEAYLDARKGKQNKQEVFQFGNDLGSNLLNLHKQIHDNTYVPDPYFRFMVTEPKEREILAPSFRDIVVQHAIYRVIYDIFNKTFISTSFACRKGYGTHKCSDCAQKYMRKCDSNSYFLQLDIHHFFASIDRNVLRKLIERKIKDTRFVSIMMVFTTSGKVKGLPIGNLLSQIYALIYLNPLDHFVKEKLKIKYYCRYVDDFVIFGLTRSICLIVKKQIENFLWYYLDLKLSKYVIFRIRHGINYVGFRTWKSKRFIRKYSFYKFFRNLKRFKYDSVMSILAHSLRTQSYRSLCVNFFLKLIFKRDLAAKCQI